MQIRKSLPNPGWDGADVEACMTQGQPHPLFTRKETSGTKQKANHCRLFMFVEDTAGPAVLELITLVSLLTTLSPMFDLGLNWLKQDRVGMILTVKLN